MSRAAAFHPGIRTEGRGHEERERRERERERERERRGMGRNAVTKFCQRRKPCDR